MQNWKRRLKENKKKLIVDNFVTLLWTSCGLFHRQKLDVDCVKNFGIIGALSTEISTGLFPKNPACGCLIHKSTAPTTTTTI